MLLILIGLRTGKISWSTQNIDDNIDNQTIVEVVATEGNTLKEVADGDLTNYNNNSGTDNYLDLLADGQGVYVLPQYLTSSYRTTAPTLSVRVRKTYTYDSTNDGVDNPTEHEMIYETSEIEIPRPMSDDKTYQGWEPGLAILFSLTFDISKLSEYDTPMTLTSQIYNWTELDVDINVYRNLYTYSSVEEQLLR